MTFQTQRCQTQRPSSTSVLQQPTSMACRPPSLNRTTATTPAVGGALGNRMQLEHRGTELNLDRGMCTIPQESVLSRSYRVLVRAGSRANAEMRTLFASHRGSFRRLLKVKVQSRPEKERINKLLSFFVV